MGVGAATRDTTRQRVSVSAPSRTVGPKIGVSEPPGTPERNIGGSRRINCFSLIF